MKLSLRNLALAAVVTVAGSVVAQEAVTPTVTKKWAVEKLNDGSGKNDSRFGTGVNGKVYFNDKAAGVIKAIDETGAVSNFASVTSLGTGIGADDAGNILVNLGFPGATSGSDFAIVATDGTVTPLTITLPDDLTAARLDQFGNVAGNMLSEEGAFVFLGENLHTNVVLLQIKNGQQVTDELSYYSTDAITAPTINTSAVVQPAYTFSELVDMGDDAINGFALRNRSTKNIWYYNTDNEFVAMPAPTGANTQEGFAVFVLGDVMYQVSPIKGKSGANYSPEFVIADESGNIIFTEEMEGGDGSQSFGSFSARKVSDYKVELYMYYTAGTGKNAAMYEITIPGGDDPVVPAKPLYLAGAFQGWDPANATELTAEEGKYTFHFSEKAHEGFKVSTTKGDWTTFNTGVMGVEDGTYVFTAGTPVTLIAGKEGNLAAPGKGDWTLTIDAETFEATLTGEAEGIEALYAVGAFQGWNVKEAAAFTKAEDGTFTLTVTAAEGQFKLSTACNGEWDGEGGFNSGVLGGNGDLTLVADEPAVLAFGNNNNIVFPAKGDWTLKFNPADMTLVANGQGEVPPTVEVPFVVFVRGEITDWAADYGFSLAAQFDVENPTPNENGEYVYKAGFDYMFGDFKIADNTADWTWNYGADGDDKVFAAGDTKKAWAGSSENFSLDGKQYTDVTLTFFYNPDATKASYLKFEGTEYTDPTPVEVPFVVFVRGEITDWAADYGFSLAAQFDVENPTPNENGEYVYKAGFDYMFGDFKIADNTADWTWNYGADGDDKNVEAGKTLNAWANSSENFALNGKQYTDVTMTFFYNPDATKASRLTFEGTEYVEPLAKAHFAHKVDLVEGENNQYTINFHSTGDAPKAVLVLTDKATQTEKEYELGAVYKGANSFAFDGTQLGTDTSHNFAIRIHSNAIDEVVISEPVSVGGARAGLTAFVDPQFPEVYGKVVVGRTHNGGIDIYDAEGNLEASAIHAGAAALGGAAANNSCPMDAKAQGTRVLFASWGDKAAGVAAFDLATPDAAPYSVYEGANTGDGTYVNNGVKVGSGTPCVGLVGTGDNTVMYTFDEDIFGNKLARHEIGSAPTVGTAAIEIGFGSALANTNVSMWGMENGLFLSQVRANGMDTNVYGLSYYDQTEDDIIWNASMEAETDAAWLPNTASGVCVNKSGDLVAVATYTGIELFLLSWDANKPVLEKYMTIASPYATGQRTNLVFDAGDNLHVANQANGYYTIALPSEEPVATTAAHTDKVISGKSGVENITVNAADANAVYYNMNGVRVDAKAMVPGVYVKVAGKTTTKVIVK